MVKLKTDAEVATLATAGKILGEILAQLAADVRPGVTGKTLDVRAQQLITQAGATAAFLNYAPQGHTPFPAALCVSLNSAVVHGIPTDTPFVEGDIVGLDLGLVYQGMYVDAARSVAVGQVSEEAMKVLATTREALRLGIAAAQPGHTIGDIGSAIQQHVESSGFNVVRQLVGHGVGYEVHEDPSVPNYGKAGIGLTLKPGLVIAIEPMVVTGDPDIDTGSDGWTVVTADGSLAAHEEHTIVVTEHGPRVLTTQ